MSVWFFALPDPEDDDMGCRLCPHCETPWPAAPEFHRCPPCKKVTVYRRDVDGISMEEARFIRGKVHPPSLTEEERVRMAADWAWVRDRADASGGLLSQADLIDGFPQHEAPA